MAWRRTLATVGIASTAALVAAAPAGAAGVAYVDGNEIWVSSLDGAQKLRLSAGEGDWREVSQSDQGYVVGVRLETNKIANFSTFTIWRPDGSQKDFGPLTSFQNGGSNAHPLGLELTPDGGLLVYGFSNYVYGFPVGNLTQGYHLLSSDTRAASPIIHGFTGTRWPTLVGERIVGTPNQRIINVQDPGGVGVETFTPWIDTADEVGAPDVRRTDVAGTGTVVAIELAYYSGGAITDTEKIRMLRTGSLGGTVDGAGQCMLPATGKATAPSLSLDASTVAWSDEGGVKVGGVPDFGGSDPCVLTRQAVTISPTGKDPSLGPIDVGAILAARNPAPPATGGGAGAGTGGAGGGPVVTGGGGAGTTPTAVTFVKLASLKLSSLGAKSGASVQVTPTVSGKATFTLTVEPKAIGKSGKKPVTIATGKGTLTSGKTSKVKLKANAAGKKAAKKLKKKKATLTVVVGGTTTSTTVTLK